MSRRTWAIGLMSGTSADGVDAALVATDGDQDFEFIDFVSLPYGPETQQRLIHAGRGDGDANSVDDILSLERDITSHHADAVTELLVGHREVVHEVAVVGFHGHTIRHQPEQSLTWQIGNAPWLAERVGIPVVYDFRRRDMAAGGQGAPLVPLFHAMLFRNEPLPLAVLNLGGVANLTWIDKDGQIYAGDTGPGCGLLDALVQDRTDRPFDHDGRLAEAGVVHDDVVDRMLQQSYFQLPFPKSADRYDFHPMGIERLSTEDAAATLCRLTAKAVGTSACQFGKPPALWVTGGGGEHPVIIRMLAEHFPSVRNVREFGLRPESLEAECFAWLAVRRLRGLPTTLPTTTGCRRPTCGGTITAAS